MNYISSVRINIIRSIAVIIIVVLCIGINFSYASSKSNCDKIDSTLLTTPAPPGNRISMSAFLSTIVPNNIDFAILGDSIATQLAMGGLPGKVGAEKPFLLAGGGDGIQQALYRLQKFGPKLRKSSPKRALLVIGTNNLGVSACSIAEAFTLYISELKKIWPRTEYFVLPILPKGTVLSSYESDRQEYNRLIENRAAGIGYTVIKYDETKLLCGIDMKSEGTYISTLFDKVNEMSNSCSTNISFDIAGLGVAAKTKELLQCETKLSIRCENYRPDNVHLSEKGLDRMIDEISMRMK